MAKTRRKKSGCKKGQFRQKRMGKGWAAHRKVRGRVKPVDRSEKPAEGESGGSSDA